MSNISKGDHLIEDYLNSYKAEFNRPSGRLYFKFPVAVMVHITVQW